MRWYDALGASCMPTLKVMQDPSEQDGVGGNHADLV